MRGPSPRLVDDAPIACAVYALMGALPLVAGGAAAGGPQGEARRGRRASGSGAAGGGAEGAALEDVKNFVTN